MKTVKAIVQESKGKPFFELNDKEYNQMTEAVWNSHSLNELPRSRAGEVSRNGKELMTPMQSIEEFLD